MFDVPDFAGLSGFVQALPRVPRVPRVLAGGWGWGAAGGQELPIADCGLGSAGVSPAVSRVSRDIAVPPSLVPGFSFQLLEILNSQGKDKFIEARIWIQ
jgi:hypothetical protein